MAREEEDGDDGNTQKTLLAPLSPPVPVPAATSGAGSLTNTVVSGAKENINDYAEDVFQELDLLRQDIRRKQQLRLAAGVSVAGSATSSSCLTFQGSAADFLDDEKRNSLVIKMSEATVPGAFPASDEAFADEIPKSTQQDELLERARLGRQQQLQNELSLQTNEIHLLPVDPGDIYEIDSLQNRMNTLQAELVTETTIDDNNICYQQERKRRCRSWGLAVVILVALVLAGLSIGVATSAKSTNSEKDDKFNSLPSNFPTAAPISDLSCFSQSSGLQSERYKVLRSILMSGLINSVSCQVDIPWSASRAALCWLANRDNFIWEQCINKKQSLVQRFTMALIYYKFVGLDGSLCSDGLSKTNWLSDAHECD